jgi:hypothetical protein
LFPRNPTIASGATPIGSTGHAPDKKKRKQFFMQDITMRERQGVNIFESIPDFFLTIARGLFPSGALIKHPTNMKSSDI